MVELANLWIGDAVRLKSSGRTGRFAGVNADGKARIDIEGKVILSGAANLELVPEAQHYTDIDAYLAEEKARETHQVLIRSKPQKRLPGVLDLHIDKLAPHLEGQPSGRILEYQLTQSESCMRQAIEQKMPHVTIIHGKGQGVLREAVEQQVRQFSQVKITFSKNGGGALEIWL